MSTDNKVKIVQLIKLSFAIAGVFMLIAAILSAYSGLIQLIDYRGSLSYPFSPRDDRGLILGLLYFIAFGLSLFAAMLLLFRKKPLLAEALVVTVMILGIATPIIYVLYPIPSESTLSAITNWTRWINGLYSGLPMITFTIPTLILLQPNRRLSQDSNMRLIQRPFAIAGALMYITSVMSVYSAIQALIDYRGSGDATYFAYLFMALCLLSLGVFGAGLFAGRLLLKGHRIDLAVILMALMLALAFPITVVAYLSLCIWSLSFIGIALLTLTFSITALILVRLNYRKLK